MGNTAITVGAGVEKFFIPGQRAEMAIRTLERQALDYPESRDEILEKLNRYAYKFRGTPRGRVAKSAVMRIAAVAMLEGLCKDDK